MSFLDDAISSIGRGLAQTAAQSLSDATGFDVGGTLNMLFGDGQTTGGQTLIKVAQDLENSSLPAADLTVLQNGVAQQTQMIADLGGQLQMVQSDISDIKGDLADLEAAIDKIGQQLNYQIWQSKQGPISTTMVNISIAYKTYGETVKDALETSSANVDSFANAILNSYDGPRDGSANINAAICPTDGSTSVLDLWTTMIAPLVVNGTIDYRDAVQRLLNYYKQMAYAQLQATNLVMEAYNFQGPSNEPQNVWQEYRGYLIAQEPALLRNIIPLITAAISVGRNNPNPPPAPAYWAFSAFGAANELNPSLQRLPSSPNSGVVAYYVPSPLLQMAEEILANLYVTETTDRRVVVNMFYQDDPAIRQVANNVVLQLGGNSGGLPINPSRTNALGVFQIAPEEPMGTGIDLNYYENIFHIRRFVFENNLNQATLPDDIYAVVSQNGNMPAISTYLNAGHRIPIPNPEFMDAGPLAHRMPINGQSPAASMNFLTYVVPIVMPCSGV